MKILFSTGSPAGYMAPPVLSDQQINCGPDWPNLQEKERWISLTTPRGEYDIGSVLQRLPAAQSPDALVCLVDATLNNVPRRLQSFRGPKVLLVADTHHCSSPLTNIIRYAESEPYDRIIFLYDRHHAAFFQNAGLKNLFWFPGLTFPHRDAVVARAAQPVRAPHLAFVGQAGKHHPRRKRLLDAMLAAKLPVTVRAVPQAEALGFYGNSLIGFNASLNGDLNLRIFEIMAGGAMLLTDRLAPESGLTEVWKEGRELVTYGSIPELIERSTHLLAHPAEAQAIGHAGAAWFAKHFSETSRRTAFQALVESGKPHHAFALPASRSSCFSGAGPSTLRRDATVVYERIQELHRTEESLRAVLDESAPEELAAMFKTLPRILVSRVADPAQSIACELLIVGREHLPAANLVNVASLWCWNASGTESESVSAKFQAAGLTLSSRTPLFFARAAAAVSSSPVDARSCLERGDYQGAFTAAKAALEADGQSLDALLIMADLALEMSNRDLFSKMITAARRIAPADPRVIELINAVSTGAVRKPKLPARLLAQATQHFAAKQWREVIVFADRVRQADPGAPEPHLLMGRSYLELGEKPKALEALRVSAKLGANRSDCWAALGLAARDNDLTEEAIDAFRRAAELDPHSAETAFLLGETLLKSERIAEAIEALEHALRLAPQSALATLWLGHARKRQGNLREGLRLQRRAHGAIETPKPLGKPKRQRVFFVVQHGPSWTSTASAYAAFAEDPAWETTVVALPYQHPYYKTEAETHAIFGFLETRNIPYLRDAEVALESQPPDLLFLQNPYDVTRPERWRVGNLLKHVPRLAYIPYALEIGGGAENVINQWNQPLQQCAWAVFARGARHKASFAKHCIAGDAHVVVTGHPKLDGLRGLGEQRTPALERFINGRKMVLWNPQFDLRPNGTPFGCGYSTFLRWREFLIAEFVRRPELAFVIRPHPLFFSALESRGLFSAGQKQEFLEQCSAAGNIWIDREPSYLPVFAAASALVTDASSFIFEFAATGKPLLYLHNPYGPGLNDDGQYLQRECATAENETAIVQFLDDVSAGRDPSQARRMQTYSEIIYTPEESVGRAIKRAVEKRLVEELGIPAGAQASRLHEVIAVEGRG